MLNPTDETNIEMNARQKKPDAYLFTSNRYYFGLIDNNVFNSFINNANGNTSLVNEQDRSMENNSINTL